MACEYCNREHKDFWGGNKYLLERDENLSLKGDFRAGIDMFIDNDILCIEAVPDVYEPCYMEQEVKINYCPMCGEKL